MAFASATPEIAARIRMSGDDEVRSRFDRIRASGQQTFSAINRSVTTTRDNVGSVTSLAAKTVSTATDAASGAVHVLSGLLSTLGGVTGFVTGQFRDIAQAAGITGVVAGVGIAGAAAAVSSFVEKNEAAIQTLRQMSDTTGLSIDTISRWQAAVRLQGGETDNFNKSLEHLNQLYFHVADAGDQGAIPFLKVGVAVKDTEGRLRPFAAVMSEAVTNIAGIRDGAERARAAFELFGDGYKDVLDVIATGDDGKGLMDHLSEAGKFGTVLSDEMVKANADLETDKSELNENLRDIGNAFTTAFLPLTGQENPVLKWLADNKEGVKGFVKETATALTNLKDDIGSILSGTDEEESKVKVILDGGASSASSGASASDDDDDEDAPTAGATASAPEPSPSTLHNPALERIAPGLRATRDVVVDLFNSIRGTAQLGDTVPALASIASVMGEIKDAAVAAVSAVGHFSGLTAGDLPSVKQVFDGIAMAIHDVRTGLEGAGDAVEFPALREVGSVAREAIGVLTLFSVSLHDNGATIDGFVTGGLHVLHDGLAAVREVLAGGLIDAGNIFSFLDPLIPVVKGQLADLKAAFTSTFGDVTWASIKVSLTEAMSTVGLAVTNTVTLIKSTFVTLVGAIEGVLPYLRVVAKALGLTDADGNGSAAQLLLVGLILHFTGLGSVLTSVATLALELVIAFGSVVNVGRSLFSVVSTLVMWAATGLAAITGLPVALAALIVVAIAAAAVAIWYYWDDIKAGASAMVGGIKALFSGLVSAAEAIGLGIWNAFTAPFRWIWDIVKQTGKIFADLWSALTGGGDKAWADLKTDWGGLLDLFMAPIKAIGIAFEKMWDGIKSGASGAWGWLSNLFTGKNDRKKIEEDVWGQVGSPPAGAGDQADHPVPPADIPNVPGNATGLSAPEDTNASGAPAVTEPATAAVPSVDEPHPVPPADVPVAVPDAVTAVPTVEAPVVPQPAPSDAAGLPLTVVPQPEDREPAPVEAAAALPAPIAIPPATPPTPVYAVVGRDDDKEGGGALAAPAIPVPDPMDLSSIADTMARSVGGASTTPLPSIGAGGTGDVTPVQQGAPLNLTVNGVDIPGLTYQPSAISQIRAAQRTAAINQRAPSMRGSGY